ncbi:MAG: hypothetical protein KAH38_00440 [Candidatus Hydrogenedentes bacterium]|nr:hypothetical protein [Candidatus Hydrogenedentota bacterium]
MQKATAQFTEASVSLVRDVSGAGVVFYSRADEEVLVPDEYTSLQQWLCMFRSGRPLL